MATTKLIVSSIVISGLGIGTVIGSYFYLTSGYTIEQLLNKEKTKKDNLKKNSQNKEGWLAKWQEYINANKESNNQLKEKDAWKLSNWKTIGAKNTEVPEAFAQKCEEKLSDKVTNKDDHRYIEFLKWCIK